MPDPLDLFSPLVRDWFLERVGTPTDVQAKAWPLIAAKKRVLVTAPTGSGKTLTAFLWGIDQLVRGRWAPGNVRVLYVSPLKALNNDIQRNLLTPLEQLRARFSEAGEPFPDIRVVTRSGDTPQSERQRMIRRPPEILITTPESLNLLLSSRKGRDLFRGLQTVILDEIHAVAPSKRGTHLMTAVERLVLLAGELQRIAISATIKPLALIGEFVGGYRLIDTGGEPHYARRPVAVVESGREKAYRIEVRFPGVSPEDGEDREKDPRLKPFLPRLAEECRHEIERHQSTLVFTNNRRHCEAISMLINKDRVRALLMRYGVLFRELLAREMPALKWGGLFRALRLMELSGEIVTGNFFEGIPGIQFASHEALRALQQGLDHDAIYWINAADPASLCGTGVPALKHNLPKRVPGTHLVYHGNRLVVVSKSYGKNLEIRVPHDHPRLLEYFGFMRHMLARPFQPMHRVSIEKINGERVLYSPYLSWLRDAFEVSADPKNVWLWMR